MKIDKVIYLDVNHEEKKEWNAKGYRVRPASLAPEGYKLPEQPAKRGRKTSQEAETSE